jgi:hypothetical protein
MKNVLLYTCLLAISTQIFAQTPVKDAIENKKTEATTPSVNPEEEAIKAVIEGENAAFNAGDVEKTRSFFNFQPYNIGVLTTQNGVTYVEAGEKFNNFYKSFKASKITATHYNYNIKINGNTAWETNDQTQMEDGKVLLTSHQMRCLEKVNGAWKIVTFSAHHSKPQTETPPSINSEEEAIKKVIIDEMDAFLTSNLEAWANAQMQTPYHSTLHKLANVSSAVGWDKKYENAKKGFGTPNDIAYKKSYLKANRTDWNIQIRGTVAWARWKDMWDMVNGTELPMYNLKILEKQNNQWRIAHAGVYTAPEETFNQAKEEEAIKKVIIEEGRDFGRGNLEAFMGAYANVPHVLWTVTNLGEPGDVLTYRGYDALKSFAESMPWFKTFKPEDAQKPVSDAPRDNWQFQFRGNIAMVNFEEHWINDKTKAKVDATVIKNFEKINGQWKLITTSALADFKDATPPIRTKY